MNDHARPDLFGPIHKAIRLAVSELLVRMGTEGPDAPSVRAELESVLVLCEKHLEHEELHVRPVLESRASGPATTFAEGHPVQERFVAELRALARNGAGRALYLHFSKFVADALSHMAEEEEVLQPLFHKLFADDELVAIHARMQAAIPPADKLLGARYMLRAITPAERRALVTGVVGAMPVAARDGFLGAMKPMLPPELFAEIRAIAQEVA